MEFPAEIHAIDNFEMRAGVEYCLGVVEHSGEVTIVIEPVIPGAAPWDELFAKLLDKLNQGD